MRWNNFGNAVVFGKFSQYGSRRIAKCACHYTVAGYCPVITRDCFTDSRRYDVDHFSSFLLRYQVDRLMSPAHGFCAVNVSAASSMRGRPLFAGTACSSPNGSARADVDTFGAWGRTLVVVFPRNTGTDGTVPGRSIRCRPGFSLSGAPSPSRLSTLRNLRPMLLIRQLRDNSETSARTEL